MPKIELVYDAGCPNIDLARAQLMRAISQAGVPATWSEWDSVDPAAPSHVRGYGSPSILVDRKDVSGAEPVQGVPSCRLYPPDEQGKRGAPPLGDIVTALTAAFSSERSPKKLQKTGKRGSLAMIPAIGLSLLPKIACPACWPAYAGFLSAMGLGFLVETTYLLPLTAVFLLAAVAALAFRAGRRRGLRPFFLGLAAATVVLVGKFAFESDLAMYFGLAALVGASLWNSWPRPVSQNCPACVGQQTVLGA